MKKALISPNEIISYVTGWDEQLPVYTELGQRVAEISSAAFEVAAPLFWIDCADNIVAHEVYYNGLTIEIIPESLPKPTLAQPVTSGAQEL